MITERAYAKLNLTLEVIRKRDDGYHDLASIMQTVDLYDELEFSESEEIEFNCSDGALSSDDNLVVKAANALRETAEVQQGVKITLTKHIPVAAGLGGGSADAAATLRGLNRLWGLALNEQQLIDMANRVGSDVPFLVSGGTAMVSGRGETLERLPAPEIARLVIVSPRHSDESRRFSGRNVQPEGLEEGPCKARLRNQQDCAHVRHVKPGNPYHRQSHAEVSRSNDGRRRLPSRLYVQRLSASGTPRISGLASRIRHIHSSRRFRYHLDRRRTLHVRHRAKQRNRHGMGTRRQDQNQLRSILSRTGTSHRDRRR